MVVVKGDTPKFEISITHEEEELTPTDSKINNVVVVVYSKYDDKKILGKYALKTLEGHTLLTQKDNKAYLICDTSNADTDTDYIIQVQTIINDANYPNSKSIQTGTADLFKVKNRV